MIAHPASRAYGFTHAGARIRSDPAFIEELRMLVPSGAATFLEWGAGCSTLLFREIAAARGGSVLSLDHNADYLASVLREACDERVTGVHQDLIGTRTGQRDPGWNYGTWPLSLGRTFDFILIDGRRRIECAVTALALCHPGTVVALHDYRRTRYRMVERFYHVQDGPQFRRMTPRGIA